MQSSNGIGADHYLQKRHKRTFSEDDRIQAQANVKSVEEEDPDDVDEPEDPLMLQREAKDWKVRRPILMSKLHVLTHDSPKTTTLCSA